MNKETILIATVTLLLGGIGGYMIADNDMRYGQKAYQPEVMSSTPNGAHHMAGGSQMSDTGAEMNHMMAMTVASEREFIEGMIPHHQEAVDTAKEVIERGGTTPEIMQLVQDIVVAQEAEIAEMKTWYEDWYGEPYTDNGSYVPMMRELDNLTGEALDRAFLEDMIMHHMGAIMMARSVQPHIEHREITNLTQAIVTTQSAEIAQMRQILQSL